MSLAYSIPEPAPMTLDEGRGTVVHLDERFVLDHLRSLGCSASQARDLVSQVLGRMDALRPEEGGGSRSQVLQRAALECLSAVLVRGVWRQDAASLEHLLDLWQARVLQWARWMTPAGIAPEDIAQDVFVTVMTRLGGLREPEHFRAWLWGVTWRVVQARKRRAWFRRWVPLPEPGGSSRSEPRWEGPERGAARDVEAVLQTLGDEQRQLLWLCYVEGYTRQELVGLLGIPEGSLNRKLTAARRDFERQARQLGLEPGGVEEVGHG